MSTINFSYNWNNKLDCSSFTTIRLRNENKYRVGLEYKAWLKQESKGNVKCLDIRHFWLADLNEFVARLDTGYSVEECRQIILRMYPAVDFSKKQLSLILLHKIKKQ